MSDHQIISHFSRLLRYSAVALAGSALLACSSFNSATGQLATAVTVYKPEVVQGNFVSKEQKEALTLGMPRAQVREILGTPLLTSAFHADRWEYVFTLRRQGQEPQKRKLTVFFTADSLSKVDADVLPSEEEFVSSLSTTRTLGKAVNLEAPESALVEFGLKNAKAAKTDPAAPAANAPTAPASLSYPPLEKP